MTLQTLSPRFLFGLIVFLAAFVGISVVCVLNVISARSASERRYLIWTAVAMWVLLGVLLGVMYAVEGPWRFVVLGSYLVLLPIFVYRTSLRRQVIREYEKRRRHDGEDPPVES